MSERGKPVGGGMINCREITFWMLEGKDRWIGGGALHDRVMAMAHVPFGAYRLRAGTSWPVFVTVAPPGVGANDLDDCGWILADGTVLGSRAATELPS